LNQKKLVGIENLGAKGKKKKKDMCVEKKLNEKKRHMWETTNENPNTTYIGFCHVGQFSAN